MTIIVGSAKGRRNQISNSNEGSSESENGDEGAVLRTMEISRKRRMDGPVTDGKELEPSARRTDARYWLLILSGCTMGETGADLLSHGPLGLGYVVASILLGALVVAALVVEWLAKRPSEGRYWTTIVVMSTAGTTLADALTRTLDLGYFRGSALLMALFLGVLTVGAVARARADRGKPPAPRAVPRIDGWYWAAVMVASTRSERRSATIRRTRRP